MGALHNVQFAYPQLYICPLLFSVAYTHIRGHSNSTGPQPPTGLKGVVTGNDTAVVFWESQQSRVCDVVIGNYSVRYQLRKGTGGIITVYSPSTSVTLQGLAHGAEYTVSVAAINSKGEISSFSALAQFTVTPTTSPPSKLHSLSFAILHQVSSCFVAHVV